MSSLLSSIGIYGWESIAPVVLSCLVARHPLMLVGPHGANKTDGAERLTHATLGPNARFQSYDTRLIQQDDLLGYANPASLKEGKLVTFVPTETSLWSARSALFDEFNRANPFVSSKVMEAVRARKVMGRQLDLELVFASCNPPGGIYETLYIDIAVASRFSIVRVPDNMSALDVDSVLGGVEVSAESLSAFRLVLDRAKAMTFSSEDDTKIRLLVRNLLFGLKLELKPSLYVSLRQAKTMVRMLQAYEALSQLGVVKRGDKQRSLIIESLIPELSGMCRATVDSAAVRAQITKYVAGLRLGDVITNSPTLESLKQGPDSDVLLWASSVKSQVRVCTRSEECLSFLRSLRTLTISAEVFAQLAHELVIKYLELSHLEGAQFKFPITWTRSHLASFVESLLVAGQTE